MLHEQPKASYYENDNMKYSGFVQINDKRIKVDLPICEFFRMKKNLINSFGKSQSF